MVGTAGVQPTDSDGSDRHRTGNLRDCCGNSSGQIAFERGLRSLLEETYAWATEVNESLHRVHRSGYFFAGVGYFLNSFFAALLIVFSAFSRVSLPLTVSLAVPRQMSFCP